MMPIFLVLLKKITTKEYAKTIDDFFTLYGYAVKKLKKPNIRARRYYTYTKTVDCRIYDAKLPKEDSNTIQEIFEKFCVGK